MKLKYSLSELKSMPTIKEDHFMNLKVETEDTRIWLSRMTKADGADYNNEVLIEKLNPKTYNWEHFESYQAK